MRAIAASLALVVATLAGAARAETFAYDAPGALPPDSGVGRVDKNVYAPDMRFPMESGPAFANSQVWGHGGLNGPGGGQCDKENFSYPWRDNYCEERSWDMPLCPAGVGHQGQDIRAATCEKLVHWVVAATDGTITNVGGYSVYLTAADGTRYDYLHMGEVAVAEGDKVRRGQRLGKVSNEFNGAATTVHLHFNIRQNVAGVGSVYVPPYLSLVRSYEDLLGISKKPEPAPPPPPAAAPPPPPESPPAEEGAPAEEGCAASRAPVAHAPWLLVGALALGGALRRRRADREVGSCREPR